MKGSLLSSSLPFLLQGTEPISLSSRYHLDPNGTLLIPSSSPEDAGTYFCTATNSAGFSSREMQLSISSECPGLALAPAPSKAAPEGDWLGEQDLGTLLGPPSPVPEGFVGWEGQQRGLWGT